MTANVGINQSSQGSMRCHTAGSNPPHHGMFARRPDPRCSIQRYSAWVTSREIAHAEAATAPAAQLLNGIPTAACVSTATAMCWIIP